MSARVPAKVKRILAGAAGSLGLIVFWRDSGRRWVNGLRLVAWLVVIAAIVAVFDGAVSRSPATSKPAVTLLGKRPARLASETCTSDMSRLGRSLGWLPAAVALPAGSYPTTEYYPKDTAYHAASLVVPVEIHALDAYILSTWPADNIQFAYDQQDPKDSEFVFQYGQNAGQVQLLKDPCGSQSTYMVIIYGPVPQA